MSDYQSMNLAELSVEHRRLLAEYESYQQMKLSLNMSRGRPCGEQLNVCTQMFHSLKPEDMSLDNGMDIRNYGQLEGFTEIREFIGSLFDLSAEEVMVCGSSSLNIMFDLITHAYTHGVYGGSKPWCKDPHPKFLCPVPGYDRHFAITEYYDIEMIPIPMNEDGPDMDLVEKYVSEDPSVKGIWCVPKYSNPTGITFSDEVVRRFARLKPAADDFRIFWDNAYCVHDLYEDRADHLLDLIAECKKYGSEHMVYELFSTSKITFAGSGLAALCASKENIAYIAKQFNVQTIGWSKLNMILHLRFLKDRETMAGIMKEHAAILRPKFRTVLDILDQELKGIATWTRPNGGYFISFDSMPGCADRIITLCREAGVTLTPAGSTYPYHKDPADTNIRIAPTSVSVEELTMACRLFCLCVKLATVEKMLANSNRV